jgi:hypothetical protein
MYVTADVAAQLAGRDQEDQFRTENYGFNWFSMAEVISFESGVTAGSKR